MADKAEKTTQHTQPAKGEPIEIPVPARVDVLAVLHKSAKPKKKPGRRRSRRK